MIIIAIDNEKAFYEIKYEIEKDLKEEVYIFDINSKEEVLELVERLSKKTDEITLITKSNLDGEINDEIYIQKLKNSNKDIKIIWNTTFLTQDKKSLLLANEIFNIIISDDYNTEKIIENIKNKNRIIYDGRDVSNNDNYNYNSNNNEEDKLNIKNNIIDKQFIAVYGTSGSGKSYITNLIAQNISKICNIKPCVVDMDFENSNIDIINNIENTNKGISKIVDDIDLNKNISNSLIENTIKSSKVDYIISNTSIYEYKNKLTSEHYLKIYNELNKKYQCVLVDLPSFPFIDVVSFSLNYATKVIFVINSNYISLRQAIKYLELINKHFNIPKNCIDIVINKNSKDSLNLNYIKDVLEGYNINLIIPFNNYLEKNINNNIFNFNDSIDVSNIFYNKKINNIKEFNNYNDNNDTNLNIIEKIKNNISKLIKNNIFLEGKMNSDNRFS